MMDTLSVRARDLAAELEPVAEGNMDNAIVHVLRAFAEKNERLRSALTGLLGALSLSMPAVFPDLLSWAEAHKEDKHHINGREARAILEAYAALANGTLKEQGK